jgi:hydrogenase maturation factor HypF (carbamoyltransferase family)
MVRLSNKVNHLIHKDTETERGRVLRGADMLKIALKFDKILESGHNLTSAINLLQQDDALNSEIIGKLSNIQVGHEEDALTVNVNNLLPGMVLLEDMITDNQSTLLAKGTELTETLLVRIRLYTQNQKMSRPIKIVTLN